MEKRERTDERWGLTRRNPSLSTVCDGENVGCEKSVEDTLRGVDWIKPLAPPSGGAALRVLQRLSNIDSNSDSKVWSDAKGFIWEKLTKEFYTHLISSRLIFRINHASICHGTLNLACA